MDRQLITSYNNKLDDIRWNIILHLFVLSILFGCNTSKLPSYKYIDNDKPSLTPKIFAPGFISKKQESEFGSVFSKNGLGFYYGVDTDGKAEIRFTHYENGQWSMPKAIIFDDKYSFNDPFLSWEEDELYYISDMPRGVSDTINDYDIWYSKKEVEGWSDPINAGPQINSDKNEYYISFTQKGTMYFASNKAAAANRQRDFDIYASNRKKGQYEAPIKLTEAINSERYEADVFIAPDESYIIFCATRQDGLGRGDLYISFKNKEGQWTPSKNMGKVINSNNHELCPFVTLDGKYFFYTSNQDIYWVDANILESFK